MHRGECAIERRLRVDRKVTAIPTGDGSRIAVVRDQPGRISRFLSAPIHALASKPVATDELARTARQEALVRTARAARESGRRFDLIEGLVVVATAGWAGLSANGWGFPVGVQVLFLVLGAAAGYVLAPTGWCLVMLCQTPVTQREHARCALKKAQSDAPLAVAAAVEEGEQRVRAANAQLATVEAQRVDVEATLNRVRTGLRAWEQLRDVRRDKAHFLMRSAQDVQMQMSRSPLTDEVLQALRDNFRAQVRGLTESMRAAGAVGLAEMFEAIEVGDLHTADDILSAYKAVLEELGALPDASHPIWNVPRLDWG
jgi:hypothetical protein